MFEAGAASDGMEQATPPRAGAPLDRASVLDGALPRGFAVATVIWMISFVARLPHVNLDSQLLMAILLGVMGAAAMVIGWRSRSIARTTCALVVAGLVNCLLVSSAVHSADSSTDAVSRVTLADWAWIPGNLLAAAGLGVIGGVVGRGFGRRDEAGATESSTQAQGWLAALAVLTTLCLISVGSLVTSMEVGLSVPDWPTSYGYNMFLFPFTKMVGGIYYEHAHRLIGTLVGLQVLTLCIWIWMRRPQPPLALALASGRCPSCGYSLHGLTQRLCPECGLRWTHADEEGSRAPGVFRWLPRFALLRPYGWLGSLALAMVIFQGLLGGFRVTLVNRFGDQSANVLAVLHACTAQLFLLSAVLLGFVLWRSATDRSARRAHPRFRVFDDAAVRRAAMGTGTALVLLGLAQTLFGALVRHFSLDWALLGHVLGAVAIVFAALAVASLVIMHSRQRFARLIAYGLIGTVSVQVLLGAATWWMTTRLDRLDQVLDFGVTLLVSSHVVVGALILLEAWLLTLAFVSDRSAPLARESASPATPASAPLQRGLA